MPECVMLMASDTSDINRQAIDKTKLILQKFKVSFSEVDGTMQENVDLRSTLFGISGFRGTYPQMFSKEGDEYKFLATGEQIEGMNEMHDAIKEMLATYPKFLEENPEALYFPVVFKDFVGN
eukprot:TRINITY_DN81914_c0_g1_i1.p1 TRINITY_DN81914_c0_g1~~TRINITY_DN81914_c0_g1_i1.p1  ORF type:complete len:122 (-),score=45.42 TRINITY_DN81914_c0_g1_i1:123-488(-)